MSGFHPVNNDGVNDLNENDDHNVILIESDDDNDSNNNNTNNGITDHTNRGETAAAAVSALTSSAGNSDSVVCIDLEDEQPGFDNGRISDDDDNGVIIVGERPAEPRQTVTLHLPGGERLQINARETDQPMHRSFEWQQDVSEARRRLLRRRRRRARELFSRPREPNYYGYTVPFSNDSPQPYDRWNQPQGQTISQTEMDRAFEAIRRRIAAYPPAVRNAFDHAQSVREFVCMVRATSPVIFRERGPELVPLFEEYSRYAMMNWAEGRIQSMQGPTGGRRRMRMRGREAAPPLLPSPRDLIPLNGHGETLADSLRHTYFHILEGLYTGSYGYPGSGTSGDGDNNDYEEARTQSIIDMIQRLEETERDKEIKAFMDKTKGLQDEFHEKARELPYGYSCNFDTTPRVKLKVTKTGDSETVMVDDDEATSGKYMEVPVCTLCGVELGVGIPDDFEGISPEDRRETFEKLVEKYECHCPYQSLMRPSQLDRDLSRRTYIALCGHTFCGRCYTRVNNAREKSKMPKRKLAMLKGSANPENYGPRLCPAENCGKIIRAKGKMRRVYF